MLVQWSFIALFFLIPNFAFVAAFFEACDLTVNMTPSITYTFQSVNYSIYDVRKRYTEGTSCVIQYIAPHGYTVKINGFVSLDLKVRIPNCSGQGQRFFVSRNGNKNLTDADVFCGVKTIALDSVGNELSVGYTSEKGGQGRFQVFVHAEKVRQENCNCGWGYYYKFGKVETSHTFKGFTSAVGIMQDENEEIVCTGVIITYKYVLSSAHCYHRTTINIPSALSVITGFREYPSDEDPFFQDAYDIESIIVHENYVDTSVSQQHDIAIIKTVEFISFNRHVSPACLPFSKSYFDEEFYLRKRFELVGWNKFVDDGSQQLLQDSELTYSPLSTCKSYFKTFTITESHLCLNRYNSTIKYPEYPGAALFYFSCDKKYLVGLFNLHIDSINTQPLVFTRIVSYSSWIRKIIGNDFLCMRYF